MEKRQEVKKGTKKLGNKGFSLVELIVVIAIMAILTVVIAPQFMRYIEKSRESVDLQTIASIESSIQAALADEAAWDSVTEPITIDFTGGSPDRDYSKRGTALETEVNHNLTDVVKFKSKKYEKGVKFTIAADRNISKTFNGTPVTP